MHPAPLGAPTGIFGLTPYQRWGRTRSCLSLAGCSRGRPWVKVASTLPAGALPLPALRTPPEGAPRRVDRDGRSIITLQVKSRTFSPTVNGIIGSHGSAYTQARQSPPV